MGYDDTLADRYSPVKYCNLCRVCIPEASRESAPAEDMNKVLKDVLWIGKQRSHRVEVYTLGTHKYERLSLMLVPRSSGITMYNVEISVNTVIIAAP